MSDLIERLKTERSVYDAELCDEAADEIERLRAALTRLALNGLEYVCKEDARAISKIARDALEDK